MYLLNIYYILSVTGTKDLWVLQNLLYIHKQPNPTREKKISFTVYVQFPYLDLPNLLKTDSKMSKFQLRNLLIK